MSTEIKLTNEQVARIFAMYLGCEIQVNEGYSLVHSPHYCAKSGAKLLLTPLSAISDEDAIEINKIYYVESRKGVFFQLIDYFKDSYKGDVQHLMFIHQYLIQQGYAVPIFIAPNHPDNGKTAIELGLAIDKTTQP